MSFPYLNETRELNDVTRRESNDSFIALTDGITHYELGGDIDGAAVLMIHGFSTPYFIFDTTFDFLVNSGFRVLRYDLFGRGYSDRPHVKYDIHLFVRQLKELLDGLEIHHVNLVSFSMGGPVGASFIDQNPGYVSRHVLIDPAGARRIALSPLLEITKLRGVGEVALALFGNAGMVRGIAKDMFTPQLIAQFQERYKVQMQYKGFKRAVLSTMRNGMLESFAETYERIGKLRIPTLIFWGRQDKTVPFADSQALCNAMPHAELHAIDDCGHLPHYEKPEEVNPILLEFLLKG
jgi:pimeloyl-ACP methyl ester carboxylesterase